MAAIFRDDIFKCTFLNENVEILIKISLKFAHRGPIKNIPALVQIKAWCRPGNKPLSEPMMVSLLTFICVTRPQWVKEDMTSVFDVISTQSKITLHLMIWNQYIAWIILQNHWCMLREMNSESTLIRHWSNMKVSHVRIRQFCFALFCFDNQYFSNDSWSPLIYYTPRTTKLLGGYTGFTPSVRPSVRPSVCPSVRPSRMLCPHCIIYSYGWILFILGTNDHYHERVCRAPWPLTLTYIFKVIRPWPRKLCPLCSVYSSGWILSIFVTNDHYH